MDALFERRLSTAYSQSARKESHLYNDRYISSYCVGQALNGHHGCVNSIEFSDDGSLLISGSDDRTVCIYGDSGQHGREVLGLRAKIPLAHEANIFHAVFLTHNPGSILSCALDGRTVLTDVVGDQSTILYRNSRTLASKIACHPCWHNTAFVGYGDGNVVWIDTRSSSQYDESRDEDSSRVVATWNPHRACVEEINAVCTHPLHPYTLFLGTNTHLVYLMDVRKIPVTRQRDNNQTHGRAAFGVIKVAGSVSQAGACEGIGGLSVSSRGSHLVVNFKNHDVFSFPWREGIRGDGETTTARDCVRYRGRTNERTMFKEAIFFHDDEYVVTGSDCGNLFFWRTRDGKRVHKTRGDGDIVNGVLAHESRSLLICSGIDNTTKVLFSTGNLQEHAESPEKEIFGRRRLSGRASDVSSNDDSDDEVEEEADTSSDDGAEGIVAQCERQNMNLWSTPSSSDRDQVAFHTKLEELRVLCMALSRYIHLFMGSDGWDIPVFTLKRMIAIVQAARQIGQTQGDTNVQFEIASSDDEEDEDEEDDAEEVRHSDIDIESVSHAYDESSDSGSMTDDEREFHAGDEEASSPTELPCQTTTATGLHEVDHVQHASAAPMEGEDLGEPEFSSLSSEDSSEDNDDEDESESISNDDISMDVETGQASSTLVSVTLMVAERLLAGLDGQFRLCLDDNGCRMITNHWYNCHFGDFLRCDALPKAARRAKFIVVILEGLLLDKGCVFSRHEAEFALWKKLVCGVLLRRIYIEMGFGNTEYALRLVAHLESSDRYSELTGLGPFPSQARKKRRHSMSNEESETPTRIVALVIKARILFLSHASSEVLDPMIGRIEEIMRKCKRHNPIVQRARRALIAITRARQVEHN